MAATLHIHAPLVTAEVLAAEHAGQDEVHVAEATVITPTGWDYLRAHRLRLRRVHADSLRAVGSGELPPASRASEIPEVLPPGSEGGVLSRGRCDHPDRSYGCKTEEFGSGFVQPTSCSQCAISNAEAARRSTCGCGGCNRAGTGSDHVEDLVQRLTDEIMMVLKVA